MCKCKKNQRKFRTRDEVLDDWVILRNRGYTIREAAANMKMKHSALEQALVRARKDGDARALNSLGTNKLYSPN
jgi:hypothetical protein